MTKRVLVVGNGLFGAAATRYLAQQGTDVVCVGAPPHHGDIRTQRETELPTHAVYSSHNDAARLTRRHGKNTVWAEVTDRAISRYRQLEQQSGVDFYRDVGCLIASRIGGDGLSTDPTEVMDDVGIVHSLFPVGDTSWQDEWPELSFPETHYVAFEPSPAGYIRPKSLIAAQNVLAQRSGAELVADTVTSVKQLAGSVQVETAGGLQFAADTALIACGAFTNFNALLPSPVDITMKSEVIVLGEVNAVDSQRLGGYPTVKYLLDPGDLNDIYMTPPLLYEDGRFYIKMGANTRLDQWFTELSELQRWFNTDTDPDYLPMYEPALRALWPAVDFLSIQTRPCIITYTPDHTPLIAKVDERLFVATAGNGASAKDSDAWGENAANLLMGDA